MPPRQSAPKAAVSFPEIHPVPRPSWSDLPASLLERLFVEAAGIRSSSHKHTGPQCVKVCSSQEIMNLTAVCRNWRQACQMSVFQPCRPWTLPSDYVLPVQLFAKASPGRGAHARPATMKSWIDIVTTSTCTKYVMVFGDWVDQDQQDEYRRVDPNWNGPVATAKRQVLLGQSTGWGSSAIYLHNQKDAQGTPPTHLVAELSNNTMNSYYELRMNPSVPAEYSSIEHLVHAGTNRLSTSQLKEERPAAIIRYPLDLTKLLMPTKISAEVAAAPVPTSASEGSDASDGVAVVTKGQPALLLQTAQPMRVERPESGKPKYCMNFHGRVPLQSTKNFILNETDNNSPILLFGRVNQAATRFVLDFSTAHLSAIQAFAIALTSFHARLT